MMNLYVRFLIVALGSSVLAWLAIKYFIQRYELNTKVRKLDLLACVGTASSTCGFIGIVLVDRTKYAESALFYWGVPITVGFVFGVIACRQLFQTTSDDQ